MKEALNNANEKRKVGFSIGSDCQSAIHRFLFRHIVASLDSKVSYEAREMLQIKSSHIKHLQTLKIVGHQDKIKNHELSFEK